MPPSDGSSPHDPPSFVSRVLIVLALSGLALGAWMIREVALLAFASVLVAIALRALADPVRRRAGASERVALAVAAGGVLAAIAGTSWLFGTELRAQLGTLWQLLPDAWTALRERLGSMAPGVEAWMSDAAPSGSSVVDVVRRIATSAGAGLADLAVVALGGLYVAANPTLYRTGALKLVPPARRELAARTLDDCGFALRRWMLGQSVSMLAVGVLTGTGLWWIGVPSPIALGLIAGLLDFVPIVGPLVAAVPAILLASSSGPETVLWTLGLYAVVQQVEGNLVQPLVQQRAVDLPAALLIFAIVAAGLLLGGLGVILAAPLTVVLFVLVKRLYVREALRTPTPMPGEHERTDSPG